MSGIIVNQGCMAEWNSMKLKHQYTYITFKVLNEKEIVVDKKGKGAYSEFKDSLTLDDCRYAVIEVPGTTKIVFVLWAPDTAPVKAKMIYASSRQALLDKLSGTAKTIQASDFAEIEEARVRSSL